MAHEQIENENNNNDQLKVDFSHRLSPLLGPLSVVDTIDSMTDRAYAQLLMLEDHLSREDEGRFNVKILSSMLETIRLEVLDVQNVARAHHEAWRAGLTAEQDSIGDKTTRQSR